MYAINFLTAWRDLPQTIPGALRICSGITRVVNVLAPKIGKTVALLCLPDKEKLPGRG